MSLEFVETNHRISFTCETDAKYSAVTAPVSVDLLSNVQITIEMEDRKIRVDIESTLDNQRNLPDCVVWNAWVGQRKLTEA